MPDRDHVVLELDGREVRFSNPDKVFFPARGHTKQARAAVPREEGLGLSIHALPFVVSVNAATGAARHRRLDS
jgi:hypothetical protein